MVGDEERLGQGKVGYVSARCTLRATREKQRGTATICEMVLRVSV